MSDILTLLWLEQYKIKKKLDKKMFYAQDDFEKSAENLFVKYITSLNIVAIISEKNTYIPKVINDDVRYEDIYVITVILKKEWQEKEIWSIIHSIIPNPVLIVFNYNDKTSFSTAKKRRSKADSSKQVIEYHVDTAPQKIESIQWVIKDINHHNQTMKNQMNYYLQWCDKLSVQSLVDSKRLDKYQSPPLQRERFEQNMINIDSLWFQLSALYYDYKQQLTEWDKAEIYMKIKSLEEQRKNIIAELFTHN